jgi:hypothetical protein
MPGSTKFLCAAAAAAGFFLARAQATPELLRNLAASQRAAMHARLQAVVRLTDDGSDPPTVQLARPNSQMAPNSNKRAPVTRLAYTWAYAEGRRHYKVLPGSRTLPVAENVWDGKQLFTRTPPSLNSLEVSSQKINILSDRSFGSTYFDPIDFGYGVNVGQAHPEWKWVADIVKDPKVRIETAADGHVRLYLAENTEFTGEPQMVELNPRWGYMIDRIQERLVTSGAREQGKSSPDLERETKVLAARKFGDCWIPTKTEGRFVYTPRNGQSALQHTVTEVTDFNTTVPESEFAPPWRPGDTFEDGPTTFLLDSRGRWRDVNASVPRSGISGIVFAVVFAIAVLATALLVAFSSRRRAGDYWGPPKAGGPKR